MGKKFKADYSGVEPQEGGGITIVAAGKYLAQVTKAEPGTTANGNPKVTVDWNIIDGAYKDTPIKFHTVVFLPKKHKFAGISLGVLKNLGQPYKGAFEIVPDNWVGKVARITVEVETFHSEKYNKELERNVIKRVEAVEDAQAVTAVEPDPETVPF